MENDLKKIYNNGCSTTLGNRVNYTFYIVFIFTENQSRKTFHKLDFFLPQRFLLILMLIMSDTMLYHEDIDISKVGTESILVIYLNYA